MLRRSFFSLILFWMSSASFALGQVLDFAVIHDSPWATVASSTVADSEGNLIIVGSFNDSIDLDPGPGVFLATPPAGGSHHFVQKLDSNGNFIWGGVIQGGAGYGPYTVAIGSTDDIWVLGAAQADSLDLDIGPGHQWFVPTTYSSYLLRLDKHGGFEWAGLSEHAPRTMEADPLGNIYLGGFVTDSVDIDFGPANTMISCPGFQCGYIAKYDSTGALLWGHNLPGSGYTQVNDIVVDSGRVIAIGRFNFEIDLDLGPSVALLTADTSFGGHGFVACYDASSNLLWGKHLASDGIFEPVLHLLPSGDLIVSTLFQDSIDLDFGPGSQWHTLGYPAMVGIITRRMDLSGNEVWTNLWDISSGALYMDALASNPDDETYMFIRFGGTMDFDPGPDAYIEYKALWNGTNSAVIKLGSNGGFQWASVLEGDDSFYPNDLDWSGDHLLLTGRFAGTIDFEPTGADTFLITGSSGVVAAWGEDSCSLFAARFDSVSGPGCGSVPGILSARATGGVAPYTYSWNTVPVTAGPIANPTSPGNYVLTVQDSMGCSIQRGIHVDGPLFQNGADMEVWLMPLGSFRPGVNREIVVDARNNGCQAVAGEVKVVLDTALSVRSSLPSPNSTLGDTLFYGFPPMAYGAPPVSISLRLTVDTTATVGDTVYLSAIVTPLADMNPANNMVLNRAFPIVNSYDPNLIQLLPPGPCAEHYALRSEPITYGISFQNTGTAEAIRVIVQDDLPASLDLSTLAVKGSSHSMITEIGPGNQIRFVFNNIHLPDSTSNEPGSHGWIIFEVKPQAGVPVGTRVENRVGIFFDYNPAVITNTVHSTLVDVIPACSATASEEPSVVQGVMAYPNPASGLLHLRSPKPMRSVTFLNLMGQRVHQWSGNSPLVDLPTDGLPRGTYLVRVDAAGSQPTLLRIVLQ